MAASTQALGSLDDGESKRIAQRNPYTRTCQAGRTAHKEERLRVGSLTLAEEIRMAALGALLHEELERHCQIQRARLDTYQKLRSCSLCRSKGVRRTQVGPGCEGSRGQGRSNGCWRFWTVERAIRSQRKGKEPHWQGKRNWKRWHEIIRTSEHAENSRSVLELRKDRPSIERLLGKATAATESGTFKLVELLWKGQ